MPQAKVGWRTGVSSSISYLLDTYSGAAAAYSLRKLSSAYTGSAITVRRSSDNTSTNIGFKSDGTLDTASLLSFVGPNNISLYSEELDNAYWIKKLTTVTSNQTTAPDGTMTADLVSETIDSNSHGISPNYASTSFPAGTNWNISCYVKKGPGANAPNTFGIGFAHGLNLDTTVLFSFSTAGEIGRYVYTNDSSVGSSMVSVGDGWYRCSVWGTTTVTSSKVACGSFRFNNNSNILSPNPYVGKTDANIYIWGWQFCKGLNDTSVLATKPYTKTTSVAAGNGFVSVWFDQSGNGRDAFQTTASQQPSIVINGAIAINGGKSAIRTAAGTGFLINQVNLGTSHSMFAVIDWSSSNREYFGSFGNSHAFYQLDGEYRASGSTTRTNASFTLNRFLGVLLRNNSSLQYYQNSATLGSAFTLGSNSSFILSNLVGEDYSWGFAGDQQEAIVYPTNVLSNRTGIESNINSFYSIY